MTRFVTLSGAKRLVIPRTRFFASLRMTRHRGFVKYISLDIGDRRVGVACGDAEVRIATPLEVIARGSIEQDTRTLAKIAHDYDVEQLIVGLPRNMDGTQGAQADAVIGYAEKVAQALHLPLTFWDERLSTVEATKRTHETGTRGKKSRRGLDAIAAAVILQDFLDSQSRATTEDTEKERS